MNDDEKSNPCFVSRVASRCPEDDVLIYNCIYRPRMRLKIDATFKPELIFDSGESGRAQSHVLLVYHSFSSSFSPPKAVTIQFGNGTESRKIEPDRRQINASASKYHRFISCIKFLADFERKMGKNIRIDLSDWCIAVSQ